MPDLYQNQAEYDRAIAALIGREDIAAFRLRILALFPDPPRTNMTNSIFGRDGNHVFCWVNPCTRYWEPGTPATYIVGIYLDNLSYNGGGKTVEGAIRRANEFFDDWLAEQLCKAIARAFANNPNDAPRAPWRHDTNWDD